jgi:uncharacterized DUF497 family protein
MTVAGFDWDAGNEAKCQKHGVTLGEIEAVFRHDPLVAPNTTHSRSEERYIAIGHNDDGRPMFIAFTYRTVGGERRIRPIGARYMHEKERKRYEASSQNDE